MCRGKGEGKGREDRLDSLAKSNDYEVSGCVYECGS